MGFNQLQQVWLSRNEGFFLKGRRNLQFAHKH
jgi:hypothetical protein